MYFTNSRSIPKTQLSSMNIATHHSIHFFDITQNIRSLPTPIPVNPSIILPATTVDTSKKILWGPPFWFFFHTMAEKVKPELFKQNREALFGIIREICNNLPCPACASHAKQYIDKINFNSIQTKHDFAMMLFEFHNSVNKRKNVPIFPYSELQPKYEKANFINIVNYFLHFYKMEHHVVRQMSDSLYRRRSAKSIQDWLHANLHIFDK